MRTRVKICGITRIEDALAASYYGADAIGLVFYEKSPRYIAPEKARALVECLPSYVTIVGLFVNHPLSQVQSISQCVGLDLLQFHGDESVVECESAGQAYMKAIRVKDQQAVSFAINEYQSARSLLVDSYQEGSFGGTGKSFNWDLLPKKSMIDNAGFRQKEKKIVLAGGLSAANVEQAIEVVQPWAVDVSSGVEVSPGIKDELLIKKFMEGVANVDAR